MNTVYLVLDEGEIVKKIMKEHDIEVLVGNGTFQDEYLAQCNALIPGKQKVTKDILAKSSPFENCSKIWGWG